MYMCLYFYSLSSELRAGSLASKLLRLIPAQRISACDALAHEYFSSLPKTIFSISDSELTAVCEHCVCGGGGEGREGGREENGASERGEEDGASERGEGDGAGERGEGDGAGERGEGDGASGGRGEGDGASGGGWSE